MPGKKKSSSIKNPKTYEGLKKKGMPKSRAAGTSNGKAKKKRKKERPAPMPISPPPLRRWRPEYIPAYLSNGVIGLRAGPIPLIEGVAIVNGLAAVDPVEKGEGFARGPYPIGGDLEIDGARLSRLPGQSELVEQAYDFASGELRSRFRFRSGQAPGTG